jgi:hypothetical protein
LLFRNIYQYLSSDLGNTRGFKIIRRAFFGVSAILLVWFLYFSFSTIVMPYQIEYREGAAQVMTQILLKGGNPFSLEYQPLGMNNYGIGYNLFALPFAKLFGNTLIIYRSVSFAFLCACLLLIAKTVWTLKKDALLSVVSGIFMGVILAGRGGLGAFPATMGAFLFLAAIIIPFLYSFHYPSLVASALLSILAYYTKPYFVIGFGVVAVYTFIFISKQKGILYSLFFLLVFGALFGVVRYVFKLYFIDTFISNLSNANPLPGYLRKQLVELGAEFYPSLLVISALLFFNLQKYSPTHMLRKGFPARSNFLQWDTPLINIPINYFAFAFVFCYLGFALVLGSHAGSYMTYAYQLVLPPLVLWLLQMLNLKNRASVIALGLLFGNILMLEIFLLNPTLLRQSDSVAWRNLYNYIENSKRVVNSPVVASALIEADILPVDSGQTEYYYSIQPYSDNTLLGPGFETIRRNGITYRQTIENAIRNHKFDRIFTTEGYGNLIALDVISQYYVQVDTVTIDMPQTDQTWVIGIWEPQSE